MRWVCTWTVLTCSFVRNPRDYGVLTWAWASSCNGRFPSWKSWWVFCFLFAVDKSAAALNLLGCLRLHSRPLQLQKEAVTISRVGASCDAWSGSASSHVVGKQSMDNGKGVASSIRPANEVREALRRDDRWRYKCGPHRAHDVLGEDLDPLVHSETVL